MALGALAAATASCDRRNVASESNPPAVSLRVGVGQLSATNPGYGLRQLSQIIGTVEGLARVREDGHPEPWLAKNLTVTPDGRTVQIELRDGVRFHDGSPLDATTVVDVLRGTMREFMGPLYSDVDAITKSADKSIEIRLRRASPFLLEALETPIRKPGAGIVGTGPFMVAKDSSTELRANHDYYLGSPAIETISVQSFPSVRAAWADLLRDRLDLLYEVGPDALDSLEGSNSVAVFTYTRHYQYFVALNTKSHVFESPVVRRALNLAIDRAALVRSALNGHGVVSAGPIWPQHWALSKDAAAFQFEPDRAAAMLAHRGSAASASRGMRFTCLVPPDTAYERIALELKRQLQAVGVEMVTEEASHDRIGEALTTGRYDAALIESVSAPTLVRPYLIWHSQGSMHNAGLGNAAVDAAFDHLREATTDDEYRRAVTGVHQAFIDDPPAIFLAWSVLSRAVSKRFVVPPVDAGRDVLGTIRLWKPAGADLRASRN